MARIPWYINSRPYTFDGGGGMNNDNEEATPPPYLPPVTFDRFFSAALNMRKRLPEDKKNDWYKIATEAAKKRGVLSRGKAIFGVTPYISNILPEVTVTAKAPDYLNPFGNSRYEKKFHPGYMDDEELYQDTSENYFKLAKEKMRQRTQRLRAEAFKKISEDYMRQPIKSVAPSVGDVVDIFSGLDIR